MKKIFLQFLDVLHYQQPKERFVQYCNFLLSRVEQLSTHCGVVAWSVEDPGGRADHGQRADPPHLAGSTPLEGRDRTIMAPMTCSIHTHIPTPSTSFGGKGSTENSLL